MSKRKQITQMIETIRKMDSDISKEVLLTMQVVPRDKFVEDTTLKIPEHYIKSRYK